MIFEKTERAFLVEKWFETKSIIKVQRAWRAKFKKVKAPDHKTIKRWVARLQKTGTLANAPKIQPAREERRRAAASRIKAAITDNPKLSIRKLACDAEISTAMAHMILHDDLKLKPYKSQHCHALQPGDPAKRVEFATWALSLPESATEWFIFSDEAWFTLEESVNKQNDRSWLPSRPQEEIEQQLHGEKVMVWCAISVNRVFGPFFFDTTVNAANYLEMLKDFFWPKLLRTQEYKKYFFQQDGAPPHAATEVQNWLRSKFEERFIGKLQWPPRSPDLNICDFFLWGYLKARVYNPIPKTKEELKENIRREIKNIDKSILKSVFHNFKKRLDSVIRENGGHIENK